MKCDGVFRGGNVAFDYHGGGVDVGTRMQAADNLIRIHETNFGVEYGDRYRPPFRRTFAKGAGRKKIIHSLSSSCYSSSEGAHPGEYLPEISI